MDVKNPVQTHKLEDRAHRLLQAAQADVTPGGGGPLERDHQQPEKGTVHKLYGTEIHDEIHVTLVEVPEKLEADSLVLVVAKAALRQRDHHRCNLVIGHFVPTSSE